MNRKLIVIALVALMLTVARGTELYPERFEFAKAAVIKRFGPPKQIYIDVRSKWEGGASSIFVIAVACWNCDVNEVYAVIASDNEKETRVIRIDTED